MTHFIVKISSVEIDSKISKIKKSFLEKFRFVNFIQEKKFEVLLGDFLQSNFILRNDETEFFIGTNLLQNKTLEDNSFTKRNQMQEYFNASLSYNKKTNKIRINSDPFGLDYYYIASTKDGYIISSHLKYILSIEPNLLDSLDYDALTEFIFSHIIFGTKTFFSGIKLLPYNCCIELINWKKNPKKELEIALDNSIKIYDFPKNYNDESNIPETASLLSNKLREFSSSLFERSKERVGFFLSGGLDSRVLIASVSKKYIERSSALTFDSAKDGIDLTTAKEIASIINIKHVSQIVSPEFIANNSFRYMWMTEGLANHVVSTLMELIESTGDEQPPLFIDGFVGDAQFGGEFLNKLERTVNRTKEKEPMILKLMNNMDYVFPKKELIPLMKITQQKFESIINEGLNKESSLFWEVNNSFLEAETLLAIIRGRGYTIGGPRTSDNYGITLLPFYHPQIFETYIQTLPEMRRNRELEIHTLRLLNPLLEKEKSTSQKWYIKNPFSKIGLKLIEMCESTLKRRLVPNYSSVPYFNWMRENTQYRSFIESLIFNKHALIWNIVDSTETQKLFKKFLNWKNHSHKFILHLIDLEILLQLFYSLKNDSEPVYIISEVLNFKRNMKIKLSLERHKKITQIST